MGREARCTARWGERCGQVKVLLEAHELRVQGAFRAVFPLNGISNVGVAGASLIFRSGDETLELALGADVAARWAKSMTVEPPALARKLGIDAAARVRFIGSLDDTQLAAALEAGTVVAEAPGTIVARIDDRQELAHAIEANAALLRSGIPIWIVYVKGPRSPFGETAIRDIMRTNGYVDTKVASVSQRLTALRFIRRPAASAPPRRQPS